MLPTNLLIHQFRGSTVVPKYLPLNRTNSAIAQSFLDLFQGAVGQTRGELQRQLQELEGDSTNYRMQRGLVHLLTSGFCTFETISPLDPPLLRQRVFALAAQTVPSPQATQRTLGSLAQTLSQELDREVLPEQLQQGLYADLPDNQILTTFNPPTAAALLHRYNLAQVQGIFYRATEIKLQAHRNDPGEYKLLFRYLKLFGLMTYIEGDADCGFTLTIDGPASLFQASTRYGLAMAKLLPALLHVTKWSLTAQLRSPRQTDQTAAVSQFALDSNCNLVSHYPPGQPFDSMVEASFAERWTQTQTEWRLEREVDLVPIPGSVMIPDFRLVHPDGRTRLLEIVGYWRPEYLQKKFAQVRQSERQDLILAVSQRLNLAKAGINFENLPVPVIWFKDKLLPSAVLALLEPAV